LFYIHLENVNKRHDDVTAASGLTFQTDPKNLERSSEEKVDPWIAPILMERSMDQPFVQYAPEMVKAEESPRITHRHTDS